MSKIFRWFLVSVVLVMLTACGGGGTQQEGGKKEYTGIVSDKIYGLSYRTTSGLEGTTDQTGAYKYRADDNITFYLNEVIIGTVRAKDRVTVFDFKNPNLVSQFFDSLDKDKNPSNGIDLTGISNSNVANKKVEEKFKRYESLKGDIGFSLEEITAYDKKYKAFLMRHHANLFPATKSLTKKFAQEIEKKIKIKTYDVTKNSALGIVVGKNIPMPAYLRAHPQIKKIVQNLYATENYGYRVRLAALNRLNFYTIQQIADNGREIIEDTEEREKVVNNMILRVGAGIDTAYNTIDIMNGDDNGLGYLKTAADYTIDASTLPDNYKPELKLATTVAYDCIAKKDAKGCTVNLVANGIDTYAQNVIAQEYPVLAATTSEASGVAAGIAGMWMDCLKAEKNPTYDNALSCVRSLSKEGIVNSLKLTTRVAQIAMLNKESMTLNSAVVALEMFKAVKLTKSSYCDAMTYYGADKEKIKDCKEVQPNLLRSKESAERMRFQRLAALAASEHKFSDFSINHETVLGVYRTLEEKFKIIEGIYDKTFKGYLTKNGKVDSQKTEATIGQYVKFQINSIVPTIIASAGSEDEFNLNLEVCANIDTGLVLDNVNVNIALIEELEERGKKQSFTMNSYRKTGKSQKVCGVLNNVTLSGSHSFITGTKSSPFLIEAKLAYSIQHSLDGKIHELIDRRLNEGRVIVGSKNTINPVASYMDGKYQLIAYDINDVRANTSGKYRYTWSVEANGCQTKSLKGIETEFVVDKCFENKPLSVTVKVYDAVNEELVVKKTIHPEPESLATTDNTEGEITIVDDTIQLQAGEEKDYYPVVIGAKKGYVVSYEAGQYFDIVAQAESGVTLVGKNNTDKIQTSTLTIEVNDGKSEAVKHITVNVSPVNRPVANAVTIGYRHNLENNISKVKPNDTKVKKWGLLNIGTETIRGVYLQWNTEKSHSLLEHDKKIILGDIAPFDFDLKQALEIYAPENIDTTMSNFGYFDVFYTKDDGTTAQLLYTSGVPASLVYRIKVEKNNLPTITLKGIPSATQGSVFTFVVNLSDSLADAYTVKLSLGDGGGGWLAPEEMMPANSRKEFGLERTITTAGDRVYRVAIFRGATRVSDWVEGSYRVYARTDTPQNMTFEQTQEGVIISWDPIQEAGTYRLYTTTDWTENGKLTEIQGSPTGDEWLDDTSYLMDKRYFTGEHKTWYFAVSADNGPVSKRYKFQWEDEAAENKYTKYLAGKSLYYLSGENTTEEMFFNEELTAFHTYDSNGTGKEIFTKLNNNGLRVDKTNVYLVIKKVNQDYLDVEFDELSDTGVVIETKKKFKLYFDESKVPLLEGDLAERIVEKTFYMHCREDGGASGVYKMFFGADGRIAVTREGGENSFYVEYSIDDSVLLTKEEDGSDKVHTFAKETSEYIGFSQEGGGFMSLYKAYQLAQDAPADECGGGSSIDPEGTITYLGEEFSIERASSYMSSRDSNEVQIFLRTSADNAHAKGGLQFTLKRSLAQDNEAFRSLLESKGTLYLDKDDMVDYGVQFMAKANTPTGVTWRSGNIKLVWQGNDIFTIEQNGASLGIADSENNVTHMIYFGDTKVMWTNENHKKDNETIVGTWRTGCHEYGWSGEDENSDPIKIFQTMDVVFNSDGTGTFKGKIYTDSQCTELNATEVIAFTYETKGPAEDSRGIPTTKLDLAISGQGEHDNAYDYTMYRFDEDGHLLVADTTDENPGDSETTRANDISPGDDDKFTRVD